jgi:hypothetical protein
MDMKVLSVFVIGTLASAWAASGSLVLLGSRRGQRRRQVVAKSILRMQRQNVALRSHIRTVRAVPTGLGTVVGLLTLILIGGL